ncbi:hypothetical protein GTG28_04230 [Vibrio sp. OCN044]|uniref:Uncharacterized protein n=1 Tax=Vibrio tetraodonis subsp. pristinus TaxID=2695891 RepID=A0A6L8LYY9_9VIBR|nr:hypothetical protein [Vibrio tetraodonis]MYM58422.1 hypothetical protein [Vibrio tetraodonis subsp. pristinus]
MEFEIYMPCEPKWLCDTLLALFALLFLIGLVSFVFVVRNEYRKIQRASRVKKRRNTPLQQRNKHQR